jgi:phosphatidylglycerophosphate synthase
VTISHYPITKPSFDGPVIRVAGQAAVQLGVLAALAATVGLQPAGWLTGTAVVVATASLLGGALRRHRMPALGAANQVTLGRAGLVAGVAAMVAGSFTAPVHVPALVAVTVVALLLDGVDGQVARRTGTVSALGARFDMEVDAFLILVLSVFLTRQLGPWVVAIGAMRYAFVAAARALPWLGAALPPRFSRKAVAAVQGMALVVASAGVLPGWLELWSVGTALALLCWSFSHDITWLARARTRAGAPVRMPSAGPRHPGRARGGPATWWAGGSC